MRWQFLILRTRHATASVDITQRVVDFNHHIYLHKPYGSEPGNANLPIGGAYFANREIGVPGLGFRIRGIGDA